MSEVIIETNPEPMVDEVRILKSKTEVFENTDDFASNADEIKKSMVGTDTAFKRKTGSEIKKFQQGVEAGTKQIHEKLFLNGYDIFDVVEPPHNQEHLAKLYEISAPHYSAVNAKVSNIVGLGYKFSETNKTKRTLETISGDKEKTEKVRRKLEQHREDLHELLDSFNEEDTFTRTLSKVWRDYEVTGNGYIEVGRKKDGTIGYVGHVPSQTVRIRRKRDGFVQISGFEVQFFAQFGHANEPNPVNAGEIPNEIIHIYKYSPTSGYYGVPDIIAAQQAVAGNQFAANFNLDYFENKAVPRHVIILKGAKLGQQAESALLSFFETGLKGQNHRTLYIPLPSGTKDEPVSLEIEPVEAGIQDSSFTNYRRANLADILMAHRVPVSKVSTAEGASLAIARDADKTFKEQVCLPEQREMEKKISKITREFTDAFDFKLNEMALTDENTQSQIDERYRKVGVLTGNEVRVARGLGTIDGADELFDMNGATKAKAQAATDTANRQRDSERSANATDSAGESRNPKGEGRTTA